MDLIGVTAVQHQGTPILGMAHGKDFVWPDPWMDVWSDGPSNVVWENVWQDSWSAPDIVPSR